jgi:uncharacterized caspase-like protein
MRFLACIAFVLIAFTSLHPANAQQAEKRVALVIGNAAYQPEALPTAANDAGLIAQTLQAAGFDVVGARDLDQDTLRRTFREFLDKVSASGPDTVAFIYLGGYGVQLEGENYFVPVDAKLARDTDVPLETLRLSDYIRSLAALNIKAGIVVLDAARANPFAQSGQPLASGLALVEPEPHMLIAFNATPGTVAPKEQGPYGAYAQALAEMIRTGGLPLAEVFDRTRLRVNETTKGGEVPWDASKVEAPVMFFDRAPDAPPPAASTAQTATMRAKPIRDLDAQDAFVAALERDTLRGYLDFLAAYPNDPMAGRVRAIVAARREAITWRHTRNVDTPQAYWSYLRRYPRGPHVADAHRRLAYLTAALEPPPTFAAISYDVPPPPEDEVVYFRQPVLVFDDPDYDFAPPPPPPVFFLPPPPPDFVVLAPPPPVFAAFVLPVPDYVPMPTYFSPPPYIAPPPQNIIYNNIHNTVVINNTTNMVTITRPGGQARTVTPAQALTPQSATANPTATSPATPPPGLHATPNTPNIAATPSHGAAAGVAAAGAAVAGAALLAPSLPKTVAKKASMTLPQHSPPTPAQQTKPPVPGTLPAIKQPGQLPTPSGQQVPASLDHKSTTSPLPGTPGGQPLPSTNGKPQTSLAPIGRKATVQPSPGTAGTHSVPPANGKPPSSTQPQHPRAQHETLAPPAGPSLQSGSKTAVQPLPSQHGQSGRPAPAVQHLQQERHPVTTMSPHMVRPAPPPTARVVSPPNARVAPRPAQMARPTPPPAVRPVPPRAAVARPAPPPTVRPAPPRPPQISRPTPPAVVRPAPHPVAVARPAVRPAPPPAARPAPPAAKRCVQPNGQPCKR